MENSTSTGTSLILANAISSPALLPALMGIVSGAIGFIFMWPKNAKEGFWRIAIAGLSSHLFGNAVLSTVTHFADWIPKEEIRAGSYLLAGLPGWWLLGSIIRYFRNTETKDLKQIAEDWKK